MIIFSLNLVLAVIWVFLTGDVSLRSLLTGAAVGFVVVVLHQKLLGRNSYSRSVFAIFKLLLVFSHRLWVASWQLVRDILRKNPKFFPAIVAYRTGDVHKTDLAILANLISLTPGSLVIDAKEKEPTLFVHSLYSSDSAKVEKDIEVYVRLLREIRGI